MNNVLNFTRLHWAAIIGTGFAAWFLHRPWLALYFVPTVVAVAKKHRHTGVIAFLNLILGWTPFTLLLLLWACERNDRPSPFMQGFNGRRRRSYR